MLVSDMFALLVYIISFSSDTLTLLVSDMFTLLVYIISLCSDSVSVSDMSVSDMLSRS